MYIVSLYLAILFAKGERVPDTIIVLQGTVDVYNLNTKSVFPIFFLNMGDFEKVVEPSGLVMDLDVDNQPVTVSSTSTKQDNKQDNKRKHGDRGSTGSSSESPVQKKSSSVLDVDPDVSEEDGDQTGDDYNFAEKMKYTFMNKEFVAEITPILSTLMTPIIESSIASAVKSLRDSIITPMMQTMTSTNEKNDGYGSNTVYHY